MATITRIKKEECIYAPPKPKPIEKEVDRISKPFLIKKVKIQNYKGRARILLLRKEILKAGFSIGDGVQFKKTVNGLELRSSKIIKLGSNYVKKDSTIHVFECKNKGNLYPMIDIRKHLESFTIGSKVSVKYFNNKIEINL